MDRGISHHAPLTHGLSTRLELRLYERDGFSDPLEDADRRKDEFLATLAHELRNPLAPLRNSLAILQRTADDPGTFEKTSAVNARSGPSRMFAKPARQSAAPPPNAIQKFRSASCSSTSASA